MNIILNMNTPSNEFIVDRGSSSNKPPELMVTISNGDLNDFIRRRNKSRLLAAFIIVVIVMIIVCTIIVLTFVINSRMCKNVTKKC